MRALRIFSFWLVGLIVLMVSVGSAGRAQAEPKFVFAVYVNALQSADQALLKQVTTSQQYESLLSKTGGLAQYPILKRLGTIVNTAVVSQAAFSNFSSYKVEVTHASGGSSWQFRLDASGAKVAGAVLLQTKEKSVLAGFYEYQGQHVMVYERAFE